MLSLSSQLISRRLLHSIRFNFIKTLQTNENKLQKTLNININHDFQQKLNRLEGSLRGYHPITVNDINQCIHQLAKPGRVRPTTTQSLLLIRCCGSVVSDVNPQKRRDLCQTLFDTLSETTDLDISHYNQLLRIFVDNEFDFNAIEILERMQSKGIEPNRVTFLLMIDRFCQTANISEAIKILEHMKSKDMPINESVFNSLIVGYGRVGDMQTARQTLDMMRSSGVDPSAETYTALLCAYAINSKNPESEQRMNEIFDELKSKDIDLNETNIFKVIKALISVDSESELSKQLLKRVDNSVNYNKNCLQLINDLLFANKVDIALRLYDTMKVPDIQQRMKTIGTPLIRSMVRANISPKTVIEICERLESEGKNDFALRIATEVALNDSNISDCRTYLTRFGRKQPLRVHYFFPMITKCQTDNEILDVLSEDMSSYCGANYSQLMELFVDYIWPKNITDFSTFMEKCKTIGFSYSITFNSLIQYFIFNDRVEDANQLMSSSAYSSVNLVKRDLINSLSETVIRNNQQINEVIKCLQILSKNSHRISRMSEEDMTDHFGQFLLTLIKKKISSIQLNQILQKFNEMSIKLSEVSVNAIRDRITLNDINNKLLTKLMTTSIDDRIGMNYHDFDDITKPRREMSCEELEGQLIELRSKGMSTRGVLRSLLMSYCRRTRMSEDSKNDVLVNESRNRVQQILQELNESNYEFTNAMNATLMEFFVNCGDVESALEMKNKISKEFDIDCYKIVNFATLYVRNGDINKGIDLIKEEKSRKPEAPEVEESNYYGIRSKDMSVYRLLNSLIEAKVDYNLLKQVFDLCIDYSSMTPTSVMAGPLVKYHILNENFSEALKEYMNCVNKYKITPWKNQLIRHFLDKEDQMNLQKVIDSSNQIHGEMNTIFDLSAVCVEAGKIKQAKKLLDTPGLRVRQLKVDTICEKLLKDNKVEEFEQWIRCARNVFDVNRDRMIYHLIRAYAKTDCPQKALNCWTLMQEEDIQPSDETLIYLANYLSRNDITVPFAVPPKPEPKISIESMKENQSSNQTMDSSLNRFNEAIKQSNLEEALRMKKSIESEGKSLLMSQNCSLIECLLNSDRIDEAFNLMESILNSKLFPTPRIIRFLCSKLSLVGDYKRLEKLRPILPDFMSQNNAFTNALSIAYINSGKAEELIDEHLLQLKPFPLGGFLRALELRPDLEKRLINIANQLVKETDFHLPLNMVWINCMKKGRFEDAKQIYNSCPKLKDFLLFSSLLDSIRENQNIVLAKNLIETLSDSNLTPKSIGVAYSALIDVYLESEQISDAEDVVNEMTNKSKLMTDSKTGVNVVLGVEHLNRSTLNRLNKAIRDKDRKFSNTSTDDSSSDEEVVDIKSK